MKKEILCFMGIILIIGMSVTGAGSINKNDQGANGDKTSPGFSSDTMVYGSRLGSMSQSGFKGTRNTIFVDDNNTGGPWDGTPDHPYLRIQQGIDNASSGDTVFVYKGMYYENVIITKSLNLIGEDKNGTVVIVNRLDMVDNILIVANDVMVSGFTLRNTYFKTHTKDIPQLDMIQIKNMFSSPLGIEKLNKFLLNNVLSVYMSEYWSGIKLKGANFCTVMGNEIDNCPYWGIFLGDSSTNNLLSGNIITNTPIGIYISSSHNNVFENNLINNTYAIAVSTPDNSIVESIAISNNTMNNNDVGIWIELVESIEISYNIIKDSYIGLSLGISITNTTVHDNSFVSCAVYFNEFLFYYFNKSLETLTMEHNTINGKTLRYYKNRNNEVIPTDTSQLILYKCNNCTIENLVLSDALPIDGIYLAFSNNNIVSKCNITNKLLSGIVVYNSSRNTISNNRITHNYIGISVQYSWGNTISQNTIAEMKNGLGLGLFVSHKNLVTKNNFINNTVHAFFDPLFSQKTWQQHNTWSHNYWDKARYLPYPIEGYKNTRIGRIIIGHPWVNFDWHPAQKPYETL